MSNEIFEKKKVAEKGHSSQRRDPQKTTQPAFPWCQNLGKKNKKKNVNRLTDDGKVEIITCHCKRGFCANTAVELQNPFRNVIAI